MQIRKVFVLTALSLMGLAACGGSTPSGASDADVVAEVAKKGAIACWADTGGVISTAMTNEAYGAHSPVLATKYTVQLNGQKYEANLSWTGFKAEEWKQYDADATHVSLLPVRPLKGQAALSLTMAPTITYGKESISGPTYKFVCPAYDVEFVDYALADLADAFYVKKTVKTNDMVRIHGWVTNWYDNYGNVFVQDGDYSIQLYKASAFKSFYKVGNHVDVVGQIVDYNGLEFSGTVQDVSFSTKEIAAWTKGAVTKAVCDELSSGNKSKKLWNNYYEGTATAIVWEYNEQFGTTDDEKVSPINWYKYDGSKKEKPDTLMLQTDDGGKFAIYLKSSNMGSTGYEKACEFIKTLKVGDKVSYKGPITYYSGGSLVEINLASADNLAKVS
ncbi:MAG: hypothetical protein K6B65_06200 [Bacilli bacterium]|nr:hypothetical protein [Bacilli bacterium]